jgi:hypothetical protein
MSILTRLTNRLRPRHLERDLQDEVEFHIDKRASEFLSAGMSADEARKKAHEQFGDIDSLISQMRAARRTSVTTLFTVAALLVAIVFWIAQTRIGTTNVQVPALPAAPLVRDLNRRSGSPPPAPRPGPTWEEFVKTVNTFGSSPNEKPNTR